MKTSYQYLQEFCKIKSRSSFERQPDPITERVKYLIIQLTLMGVEYTQDIFPFIENYPENYINLYVHFKAKNPEVKETIIFLAHHDIANPFSENCQDNSSSVCNLLEFCSILKDKELEKNIIVCFVDGEEPASFNSGAGRIGKLFKYKQAPFDNIEYAINLELTGKGRVLWMDYFTAISQYKEPSVVIPYVQDKLKGIMEVGTPFNDCYTLRYYKIDSICIGCFTTEDALDFNARKYPKTWALCHSPADTIDKISEEDMHHFVHNTLLKLIV